MKWRPGAVFIYRARPGMGLAWGMWVWICCPAHPKVVGDRECRWGYARSWRGALAAAKRHMRIDHGVKP